MESAKIFKGKQEAFIALSVCKDKYNDNFTMGENPYERNFIILWNKEKKIQIRIDNIQYELNKNELLFLTDLHKCVIKTCKNVRILCFNRSFHCIINNDSQIGCKGILFFGASEIPIISIPAQHLSYFEILWNIFEKEISLQDDLQFEMLQLLLKRLLILSTRLYTRKEGRNPLSNSQINLIREFNFLVENHFKEKHSVKEYADLLHKSPKTLSNLFRGYQQKSPLQIIQNRIYSEALRLLQYTDKSIKEIAYELGFKDLYAFSRFIKQKSQIAPRQLRDNLGK